MKKHTYIIIFVLVILLIGCNFPGYEAPVSSGEDSMATEIAKILTGTPVQILVSPAAEEGVIPTQQPPDVQPTSSVGEVPTSTSTAIVLPTATLADTDPSLTLGTPDWVDTMENDDNWPTGYNQYTTITFKDGFLKMTGETQMDGWRLTWPFLDDFYLETKLQSPKCEGSDRFGLMFRVPENAKANKGYLFGITCDGKYSLRKWDSQTMTNLVNWTASSAIHTGKDVQNTLGVMARGQNIALYINGQKVNEISDSGYLEGSFGIFVGSNTTEKLTVWVDQIRYWENP